MATGGIVPPLDVAEDRHPGLGLRCEPAACQQLAFQRSEEALAHGVIVGVTNRSHGWAHTGFPAAAAERQRCILGALVAVVDALLPRSALLSCPSDPGRRNERQSL